MLMTSPVECIDMNMPLRGAIMHMLQKKISSLLIVDAEEMVVGIVTTDDILWHLAHLLNDEGTHLKMALPDVQTIGEVANQVASTGI
jgi:signal-transduction protein with cAMP-binding, CBS, and nucleotidyltransferase domain